MNKTTTTNRPAPNLPQLKLSQAGASAVQRRTVSKTGGHTHGPITRLVSPHQLGELIKPFVFLDHGVGKYTGQPLFGIHPHSGIATLTAVLKGGINYEDTTGKSGEVLAGGLEWMKAGNGVWHDGGLKEGETTRLFQLWVALPAEEENAPAESQYIHASEIQQEGPVRVLLGRHGQATSPIRAPRDINYFHIRLKPGQTWSYLPPAGHTVAWLAVDQGRLHTGITVEGSELAVFEESSQSIEVEAAVETSFVFGSAVKHPHPLVTGYYSVHTSPEALAKGEAEILRIGRELRAQGRLI
jgi:redox-sensitive bicupin YhaK (pirin superfamily)